MAEITISRADSACVAFPAVDMILADPPYELPGATVARIIERIDSQHLVLITTMSQLIDFLRAAPGWRLNFDFVLDGVAPKQSKSRLQPNYLHQTGAYLTRGNVKSRFSRFLRPRSDVADANGYWPTIIRAPRINRDVFAYGKNATAITDILGSFAVASVADPFAGSGTTGLAAIELEIDAFLVEQDDETFAIMRDALNFMATVRTTINNLEST